MRRISNLRWVLLSLAMSSVATVAQGQFEAPPDSLAFEDKGGSLEAVQGDYLKFRDSRSEAWVLELVPETKISVKGEAQSECLRPGVFVQLTAKIDKKGQLVDDVNEIEIFTAQGKPSLGLFTEADSEGSRPIRNPTAGTYRIKGKLASYKDGDLLIIAGNRKLSGTAGKDLKVTLNADDPSLGQMGDDISVKAWYYDPGKPNPVLNQPGKALAEEITITLAKPLAHSGKKARSAAKSAKAAAAREE